MIQNQADAGQQYTANVITVLVVSPLTFRTYRHKFAYADEIERLLVEQHQHRYQMFVDHMHWRSGNIGVSEFLDPHTGQDLSLEYDDFDRDNSIYSIAIDPDFRFRGSTRATSSVLPTMLELDEFRDISFFSGAPVETWKDEAVFEGTRIISPNSKVYGDERVVDGVLGGIGLPLLYSHLELAVDLRLKGSIGTMPPDLQKKLYGRMGLPVTPLGPPVLIKDSEGHGLDEGVATQAYAYDVTPDVIETVRRRMSEAINLKMLGAYQMPERMNNYGVSDAYLPEILNHMKANLNVHHPHRLKTDLNSEKQPPQTTMQLRQERHHD